jgi:hypothetical protein
MYLYPPEAGWLPILVASYDTHGLRWTCLKFYKVMILSCILSPETFIHSTFQDLTKKWRASVAPTSEVHTAIMLCIIDCNVFINMTVVSKSMKLIQLNESSLPPCPERLWGPPSLLSNGYGGALSLGVKRPGRETDHSSPSSAEVKNAWRYTSTPAILLHGVVLS